MSFFCDVTSGRQGGVGLICHLRPALLDEKLQVRRLLDPFALLKGIYQFQRAGCDICLTGGARAAHSMRCLSLLASDRRVSPCSAMCIAQNSCSGAQAVLASGVLEDVHLLAMDILIPPCRSCSPQQKARYQPPHLRRQSSSSSGAVPPCWPCALSDCHPTQGAVKQLSEGPGIRTTATQTGCQRNCTDPQPDLTWCPDWPCILLLHHLCTHAASCAQLSCRLSCFWRGPGAPRLAHNTTALGPPELP